MILSFIIIAMGTVAKGQSIGMDIGLIGGINISTHTDKYLYAGNVAFTPHNATGYQVGVLVREEVVDRLKVQVEPSVVKLGARYQESFVQQELQYYTESWTRLVYLQLPVMAQYSIDPFIEALIGIKPTSTRYHLRGGLFGAYLLDAQFKGINYNERILDFDAGGFSKDVMIRYSKYDAGFVVGAGFEYDRIIGVDARLQYTLLQSYKGEPMYQPKNVAFMFSLTYLLFND